MESLSLLIFFHLGIPQPVEVRDIVFQGPFNNTGLLTWTDRSERDVSYYRVIESSGLFNATPVRSPSALISVSENTPYTIVIESIGLCGRAVSSAYSFNVTGKFIGMSFFLIYLINV